MPAADIGDHADAGFRHGEERAVADDAKGGRRRNADAAAHDDAVDQRDARFGEMMQERIEAIFLAKEPASKLRVILRMLVKPAQIAAGAKSPVARALDKHRLDGGRALPRDHLSAKRLHHLPVERIHRARAVQGDDAEVF